MTAEQAEERIDEEDRVAAYFDNFDQYIDEDDDGEDENEFAALGDLHDLEVEARLCGGDEDFGDDF